MNFYQALKITISLAFILMFASATNLIAQEVDFFEEYAEEPTTVRLAGINLNGMYPKSTFKKNLKDEKGFGGGLFLLYQVKPLSPHFIGFDIEYDHLYNDVSVFNGLEERVNSAYVSMNFNWRIFPDFRLWLFEPYMEVFMGPNFIFTSTNVLDDFGQTVDFSFDQTNFGFEYGVGAGFTMPIAKAWFLDVQYIRTQTSIAQYLILPNPNGNFEEVNSANDHTKLKVGVIYAF